MQSSSHEAVVVSRSTCGGAKLFVSCIPRQKTECQVKEALAVLFPSSIESIVVMVSKSTNKGHAFVHFSSAQDAAAAVQEALKTPLVMDGSTLILRQTARSQAVLPALPPRRIRAHVAVISTTDDHALESSVAPSPQETTAAPSLPGAALTPLPEKAESAGEEAFERHVPPLVQPPPLDAPLCGSSTAHQARRCATAILPQPAKLAYLPAAFTLWIHEKHDIVRHNSIVHRRHQEEELVGRRLLLHQDVQRLLKEHHVLTPSQAVVDAAWHRDRLYVVVDEEQYCPDAETCADTRAQVVTKKVQCFVHAILERLHATSGAAAVGCGKGVPDQLPLCGRCCGPPAAALIHHSAHASAAYDHVMVSEVLSILMNNTAQNTGTLGSKRPRGPSGERCSAVSSSSTCTGGPITWKAFKHVSRTESDEDSVVVLTPT